jgi:hypothetical protein
LSAAGDRAVAFVKERIEPARAVPAERIAALVADLDSERFQVREKAEADLEKLGDAAIPSLRKVLKNRPPSLELRRRLERVLARLAEWESTPQGIRAIRVIEVLEHVGTPSARDVLKRLAEGVPEATQTREAKASLRRLIRDASAKRP